MSRGREVFCRKVNCSEATESISEKGLFNFDLLSSKNLAALPAQIFEVAELVLGGVGRCGVDSKVLSHDNNVHRRVQSTHLL